MRERILLMGAPGTGKSTQLLNVVNYVNEFGIHAHVIDLEDKLTALLGNQIPKNMTLYTCVEWEELIDARDKILTTCKPDEWIFVDRVDLAWNFVQRFFSTKKYNIELAERLLDKSIDMKKRAMFIPRFDAGDWPTINENYESFIGFVFYRSRCNALVTSGIRAVDPDSKNDIDIFSLGINPRGQKELGHQPISAFLLQDAKKGKEHDYLITTAKEGTKNRVQFDHETLYDFTAQYLSEYYPEKKK